MKGPEAIWAPDSEGAMLRFESVTLRSDFANRNGVTPLVPTLLHLLHFEKAKNLPGDMTRLHDGRPRGAGSPTCACHRVTGWRPSRENVLASTVSG